VKETSTASAAALLTVMSVPGVDKLISMFLNHLVEHAELIALEASRLRQLDRLQPESRVLLGAFNMDTELGWLRQAPFRWTCAAACSTRIAQFIGFVIASNACVSACMASSGFGVPHANPTQRVPGN
jgi:hypothetical protein